MQNARATNPDKFKSYQLKKRYGIDLGVFTRLLEQQDHKCAICGTEQDETFHLDHCHSTGAVRGLLCRACNTGIGNLRDDPVIVAKALAYLNQPTSVQ